MVSPVRIDQVEGCEEETSGLSQSLVKREIVRMKDFADLAENTSVADDYIYSFIERYGIELEEDTNECD